VDAGYEAELARAIQLADLADEITMRHYLARTLSVETKPDNTPVTQADLEVEQALSEVVTAQFGDAYVGEEGVRQEGAERCWIVDPIDGTKNYLRGMPVWGTLIALSDDSGPLAAVVSSPALNRRWWATRGGGAWTRDAWGPQRQLAVSKVARLADAFILYGSLFSWDRTSMHSYRILALLKEAWRHRSVGDFLGHLLVAEGAADICVEPDLRRWDIEAPALIVAEAGGAVWQSRDPTDDPGLPRIVVTSNGAFGREILARPGWDE